jgi:hypothetical protein
VRVSEAAVASGENQLGAPPRLVQPPGPVAATRRYTQRVAAQPVMTVEELAEALRHAPPPTEDDVTILWDGRRLDSREAVMEWLAEVEAKRAEEAAAAGGDA